MRAKLSKLLKKWEGPIVYFGSMGIILAMAIFNEYKFLHVSSTFFKMIYPKHVIVFFEQFYGFYLHLGAGFIFFGINSFVCIFSWILQPKITLRYFVPRFLVFGAFQYFLLPFVSIVLNVFLNVVDASSIVDKSLSKWQIFFSGFYVILMFASFELLNNSNEGE